MIFIHLILFQIILKSTIKYFFVLVFLTEFLAGQDSTKTKYWVIEPFGGIGYIPMIHKNQTDGYQYNFKRSLDDGFAGTPTTRFSNEAHGGLNAVYRLQKLYKSGDIGFLDIGIGVQLFNYKVNYSQKNWVSSTYVYDEHLIQYYINRINIGFVITHGIVYTDGIYVGHSLGISYQTHINKKEISNTYMKFTDTSPGPFPGGTTEIIDEKIKNYTEDTASANYNVQLGYKYKQIIPYFYGQFSAYNISKKYTITNIFLSMGIGCKILLK